MKGKGDSEMGNKKGQIWGDEKGNRDAIDGIMGNRSLREMGRRKRRI